MSTKNHPNFHAVKFASGITALYYECLRGQMITGSLVGEHLDPPNIRNLVLEFTEKVEEAIDLKVRLANVTGEQSEQVADDG